MSEKTITVYNKGELTAITAAEIVTQTIESSSDVLLKKNGLAARGSSILEVMFLNVEQGDSVEITVNGVDAEEIASRLEEIFEHGGGI